MTQAQRALSAPAYIELRQRINAVMSRRLGWIYLGARATVLLLLVLSLRSRSWSVVTTAAVALLCLLVDGALMLRENVPINSVIDRWSTTDYPADWEDYRSKWFAVFGHRQVVLLVGFFSLVVGAVIQSEVR
jgi:hypothetical protein